MNLDHSVDRPEVGPIAGASEALTRQGSFLVRPLEENVGHEGDQVGPEEKGVELDVDEETSEARRTPSGAARPGSTLS